MERTNKKKKVQKINMKKVRIAYVIGLVILIYFVYAIIQLIKQPTDVFVVENGSLSEEESAIGYVIRKETVVQGDNYKNGMIQIKTEGERVAKGDSIFRYYSNNEETLVKKIQELDIKIQDAMSNQTDIFSSDMKVLDSQIEERLVEVAKSKDIQKIAEYKKDITTRITKKAKIAGDLSPSGSYIKKLIEERSNYENALNSGSEYINAPESGIVSYRVDGLENVLTPESFSTLNKKFLEELKLKTGEIVSTSEESGKIIDNFEAYIATSLESKKAKEANVGDAIKLRLSNSQEITAKVEYIIDEGESKLLIFKITNGLDLLANYRKITFDIIWWNYSGLKVPNDALVPKEVNGKQVYFITRNRMGYTDEIEAKVLKQNDSYSIISNYTNDELKNDLGYNETQIKQAKTIVLHDEIIINHKKVMLQKYYSSIKNRLQSEKVLTISVKSKILLTNTKEKFRRL